MACSRANFSFTLADKYIPCISVFLIGEGVNLSWIYKTKQQNGYWVLKILSCISHKASHWDVRCMACRYAGVVCACIDLYWPHVSLLQWYVCMFQCCIFLTWWQYLELNHGLQAHRNGSFEIWSSQMMTVTPANPIALENVNAQFPDDKYYCS
jgi:hypothetical protein